MVHKNGALVFWPKFQGGVQAIFPKNKEKKVFKSYCLAMLTLFLFSREKAPTKQSGHQKQEEEELQCSLVNYLR